MDAINRYATQHRESVAYVFRKYGIKNRITPQSLRVAILAAQNTNFVQDLNNAIIKRDILKQNSFEDNFDYYVVDAQNDCFDGGEVVHMYYEDVEQFDEYGGKLKAKRQAKKVKRKEKKAAKKAAKSGNYATAENAVEIGEDAGRTTQEKMDMAMGIISPLAAVGGQIAGQFINKGGDDAETTSYSVGASAGKNADEENTGVKQYMPYILGGIAVLAVLGAMFYFLKKRKS